MKVQIFNLKTRSEAEAATMADKISLVAESDSEAVFLARVGRTIKTGGSIQLLNGLSEPIRELRFSSDDLLGGGST